MRGKQTFLGTITLVGITTRTSNADEINPETARIGGIVASYFGGGLAEKIEHRSNPGVTYSVYTNYESDEHGAYTYFMGEAVSSLEGQDLSAFTTITIPPSAYKVFTTQTGEMPGVVINAWQKIWAMNANDFGGDRSYVADFEVYDQRALNPQAAEVDIYIGIKG